MVIKNCDPCVLGPALAIERYPGAVCWIMKFSSVGQWKRRGVGGIGGYRGYRWYRWYRWYRGGIGRYRGYRWYRWYRGCKGYKGDKEDIS